MTAVNIHSIVLFYFSTNIIGCILATLFLHQRSLSVLQLSISHSVQNVALIYLHTLYCAYQKGAYYAAMKLCIALPSSIKILNIIKVFQPALKDYCSPHSTLLKHARVRVCWKLISNVHIIK